MKSTFSFHLHLHQILIGTYHFDLLVIDVFTQGDSKMAKTAMSGDAKLKVTIFIKVIS